MTFEELQASLRAEGIRLVVKDTWPWKIIHWVLVVVTFGGNRQFLDGFLTTIGPVIGVPRKWRTLPEMGFYQFAGIEHERVHTRQFKKVGFGNPWIGIIPGFFWYVLFPLPLGFAWGRWVWEREAYLKDMKWRREHGETENRLAARLDSVVTMLTGGKYGWTMPFKGYVRKWFTERLAAHRTTLEALEG